MAFAFTPEKARLLLQVITALANGETIQHRMSLRDKWEDKAAPSFDSDPNNYRVKPKQIATYHYLFPDGSMSMGKILPEELNRLYGNRPLFEGRKVKLTREDGKPIKIEVVE